YRKRRVLCQVQILTGKGRNNDAHGLRENDQPQRLDECDLTTRDLDQIRSAFVKILQGVFHPRIKYPEEVKEELTQSSPAALPSPQSVAAGEE
ncbi:MAG: hypothetical protein P8186_29710, partial [Anaerolineae bacterium]